MGFQAMSISPAYKTNFFPACDLMHFSRVHHDDVHRENHDACKYAATLDFKL